MVGRNVMSLTLPLRLAVGRRPTRGNKRVTFPTRRAAWVAAILRT
jgi:hypothetical protein